MTARNSVLQCFTHLCELYHQQLAVSLEYGQVKGASCGKVCELW